MKRTAAPKRIAILGCGAVGRQFALGLSGRSDRRRGVHCVPFRGALSIWSRSRRSMQRCLGALTELGPSFAKRVRVAATLEEAIEDADVVLLCVSDADLRSVAEAIAKSVRERRRKPVLLVASGYQDLGALRRRIGRGMALGRFHPLTPVFDGSVGLVRVSFGIEGDDPARRAARALLPHWDAKALELRAGNAARYHAGAALLGGGTVALFALAEACMAPAVRSRRGALRLALFRFATDNVYHATLQGPVRALTGPLARGSDAVVRGHLRALRAVPEARAAYRLLGRTMLGLARSRGSIDAATERRLRRLLQGRAGRR